MHSSFYLATLALAGCVIAKPVAWSGWSSGSTFPVDSTSNDTVGHKGHPKPSPANCLNDADAEKIVNGFINMLENTKANFDTDLANSLLADDFTDTSDSINSLAGIPLTTVTFPSKQAFIAGQGANQAIGSVNTLNIWHDCDTITWRWRAYGVGPANTAPVTGINVMEINHDKQIETNYSEFNSAAWLLDLGNPECQSNATGSSSS